jgi:hypothetical protein
VIAHALAALLLLSGDLRVEGDATSESRAGETPIVPGQVPRDFVAEILTPQVALRYLDPAVHFEASYAPRIQWQTPNASDTLAPLVLHTGNLLLDAHASRRLRLVGNATGSYGKPDYMMLQQILGPGQASLPAVQSIASASVRAGAFVHLSRRWDLEAGAQLFYWKWLDASTGTTLGPGTITEQQSAQEDATTLFRLDERNEVGLGAIAMEASYSTGLELITVGPTGTWRSVLTRESDLRLTLGVTYARAGGSPPPGATLGLAPGQQAVAPLASLRYQSHVARSNELFVLGHAGATTGYYVDPILGQVVPRALVDAGVSVAAVPNWLATLQGDFTTALRTAPLVLTANATPPDETAFSLTLSVRRRFSANFFGEVGGRWSDRGPAFVEPDFHFHQRQLWIYVMLIGTTRPLSEKAAAPTQS